MWREWHSPYSQVPGHLEVGIRITIQVTCPQVRCMWPTPHPCRLQWGLHTCSTIQSSVNCSWVVCGASFRKDDFKCHVKILPSPRSCVNPLGCLQDSGCSRSTKSTSGSMSALNAATVWPKYLTGHLSASSDECFRETILHLCPRIGKAKQTGHQVQRMSGTHILKTQYAI